MFSAGYLMMVEDRNM